MIGRLAAVALIAAGIAVAGCGGDDSGDRTTTNEFPPPPTITSPLTAPTTTVQPTTSTTGKTKTTKGGNTFDPGQPDSETNDVPPAKGSPQEAFEKQCQQNPKACG